jgi:hypothetical protein
MMISNDESSGREVRAVLNSLRINSDQFDRLSSFARGYLAHAENHDGFLDQSYFFDGYEIAFSVSENGWVSVSAYPSSFETGTDWACGFKLFSVRGA